MDSEVTPFDNAVRSLQEIGFTLYQARAYVALNRMGATRVQALSNASGVPRNKLYDALDVLERRGLVHAPTRKPLTVEARPLRPYLENRMYEATRLVDAASGGMETRERPAPMVRASRPWWAPQSG